ncbi:MFS transporter [Rhodococcus sp. YH1]|uniref:MFS transporter n=1 Tax=Rhodococcus sp. YH1 TaxID=89066 RepID=UPI00138723DE|nr:Antiseptic resistance protein [Rhodococcus sp. YH1]
MTNTGQMPGLRPADAGTGPAPAGVRTWAGLVVLACAVLLIAVDATVLDLALPFLSADLAPSGVQLLWIIDVYSFAVAGLLVTMGVLGDRVGRRRLLLVGAVGFAAASAVAAWAVSPEMLILARALQGISGATLMPATLGLIRHMFTDPRERTVAIGVWGAMAGGGAALGPLVGGWLLEHFWWGSVFLINLPIMAVLVLAGPFLVPESRDPHPGRFDLPGAALSLLAVVPIVYAVKETALHGPHAAALVALGGGLTAAAAFVHRQRVAKNPLLDLTLFRRREFSAAVLTNLLAIFALAGVLFFGSQYLQLVLGIGPLQAGLLMLPGTATSALSSLGAAWLVRRLPVGTVLSGALAIAAVGAALLLALGTTRGAGLFVVGFTLIGVGVGVALTLTIDLVVGAAPADRAGAASAVSETAYELGVALGVAVLGSVVTAVYRSRLGIPGSGHEFDILGGAVAAAGRLPAAEAEALLESARDAFVAGTHGAAAATAVILAATAALTLRMLRRR